MGLRQIPGVEGLQGGETVEFTLTSEDGDEGFPGEVLVKVFYTTGKVIENGKEVIVLGQEYDAELVGGAEETVVNITNHSYALKTKNTIPGRKLLTQTGTSTFRVAQPSREL